jgi:hypothetical protein
MDRFGRLQFAFYVAASQAYPITGGRPYVVANVFISHGKADSLAGWDRPIVIELAWWRGYFGLQYHKEYALGEHRYATVNDPTGEYLRRFLDRQVQLRPKPWQPRTPKQD